MAVARNASGWTWLRRALGPVLLLGLYLCILYGLRPELLLHSQSPAFFAHWPTFVEHVRLWPGGLVEYLAAGLMATFVYPAVGAVLLTAALVSVYWLTLRLSNRMHRDGGEIEHGDAHCYEGRAPSSSPATRGRAGVGASCPPQAGGTPYPHLGRLGTTRDPLGLAAFPPVLLLLMLSRYTLPLSVILALCIALAAAHVYMWSAPRRPLVRFGLSVFLCAAVYLLAGSVSVLLACICAVFEILRRQRLLAVLILAIGAAMPYLAASHLYGISQTDAYLRLTAIAYDFSPPITSIALYACFPAALLQAAFISRRQVAAEIRRNEAGGRRRGRNLIAGALRHGAEIALTLLLMFSAVFTSLDRRAVLAVDYHARQGQWQQALEAARRLQWSSAVPGKWDDEHLARTCVGFHFPVTPVQPALLLPTYNVAIHDINQALAHSGRLLDDMFRYPQRMGVSIVRLLPDDMGAYVTHSYNPDILLQLGHVNEAERVTCECLANVGPRPWLLERLVAVSVLKGHAQAARMCLAVMARDPGCRRRAEALRAMLDADPTLARWEPVRLARTRMYRIDRTGHIAGMDPDEEMLRYLLMTNPRNRLAFDYLMAHYLLTLRTDQVVAGVRHLRDFGYTALPRHFEEALLLRASMDGKMPDLASFTIRPETQGRFESFQRAIDKLGGPGDIRVRDSLVAVYGDTYWFYALFGATFWRDVPATRPAEGP